MARRFPNQASSFNRSARPNRSWDGFFNLVPQTIGAGTKVLIGSFALNNPGIDETVLRTVGMFSIASDQAGSVEV